MNQAHRQMRRRTGKWGEMDRQMRRNGEWEGADKSVLVTYISRFCRRGELSVNFVNRVGILSIVFVQLFCDVSPLRPHSLSGFWKPSSFATKIALSLPEITSCCSREVALLFIALSALFRGDGARYWANWSASSRKSECFYVKLIVCFDQNLIGFD